MQPLTQEISESLDVMESEANSNFAVFSEPEQITEPTTTYYFLKRTQDILFSAVGLIILFPLFILISVIIFIDDPHADSIFIQKRVGKDGKVFRFFKFRTMYAHAEEHLEELKDLNEKDGPVFKIKNDPRITRVGKFLRKSSLDELPQLVNVLSGTMSLVGPRPPLPAEVEQYTPYDRQRLSVKPGLTCYWQIQPDRDDISFHDWVTLDIKYIKERSFIVDWKILFATVGAVIRGSGH